MWGKHRSLPTDKLVLVSKSGFTPSATKKADWLNITTYSLKEAEKLDWSSTIRGLSALQLVSFVVPYVIGVTVILANENDNADVDIAQLDLTTSTLYHPDGKAEATILEVVNRWLGDPALIERVSERAFTGGGTVIGFERRLKDGTYLVDNHGKKRRVVALKVKAKCRKEVTQIPVRHGAYGNLSIAYGFGESLGKSVGVAVTQKKDETPIVVFRVSKKM